MFVSLLSFVCITSEVKGMSIQQSKTNKTQTNKTYKDETLQIPVYTFGSTGVLHQLLDSLAKLDKHPSLTLSLADQIKYPGYIQIKHQTFDRTELDKLSGVMYVDNKKVYIYNIPDSTLSRSCDIIHTGDNVSMTAEDILKDKIDDYPMGYYAIFSNYVHNPGGEESISIYISFNGEKVSREPEIGRKFAWLSPIYECSVADSLEYNRIKQLTNNNYKGKKEGLGGRERLNATNDTIYSTLNGLIVHHLQDSVLQIPLYSYNNSENGIFMKQMDSTIHTSDVFNTLWIKAGFNENNQRQFFYSFGLLSLNKKEEITGVIINKDAKHITFLKNFTDSDLRMLGIEPMEETVTLFLKGNIASRSLDTVGYGIWLVPSSNGKKRIIINFANKWPPSYLSKPFEWMYDL